MSIKVGLVSFGSAVRGLFREEMSQSNAAIIDSVVLGLMAREYDAQFYILGCANRKTLKALENARGTDYGDRFTLCESAEDEPENLDLLWVQTGSENLRFGCGYRGTPTNHNCVLYGKLLKYNTTPVLYNQTDFATPLWLPVNYSAIMDAFFPTKEILAERNIHVLAVGNPDDKKIPPYIRNFMYHSKYMIPHFIGKDYQSIIGVYDTDYEAVEVPTKVAFAGKDRNYGSRSAPIVEMFGNGSDTPLRLIGKWKPFTTEPLESNPNTEIEGRYFGHDEVLKAYNEAGFTIYLSCGEYRALGTITSRMYDAISSRTIPLIYEEDYPAFSNIFGDEFECLKVTRDTIQDVMASLASVDKRNAILDRLTEIAKKNYEETYGLLVSLIGGVLEERIERRSDEELSEDFVASFDAFNCKPYRSRIIRGEKLEGIHKNLREGMPIEEARMHGGAKITLGLHYECPEDDMSLYQENINKVLKAVK